MSSQKTAASLFRDTMVTVVDKGHDTDRDLRKARTVEYPPKILYFIACFTALISVCHFSSILCRFITRKRIYGCKRRTMVSLNRLPVAVADSFQTLAFRWTVPVGSSRELNFVEVGLTFAYVALLFSATFVNTRSLTGVKFDPMYYADRAGTMTASQLPIVVALGMKNNLISWLTGVSFTKLNYLHRMSTRTLCILVWIHAGGRITLGLHLSDGGLLTNIWILCGIVAGSTLTFLCFLSLRPIRERNYEAFLWLHFIFVFMFVLAVYFHLKGRGLTYYGAWPMMILWGLDRLLCLIRLATVNFGYLNPWSSQDSKKKLDAVVEVLSPRFVRVSLHRPKHFHWRPGQNAYLSFPTISTLPFEFHPFTISTIHNDSTSDDSTLVFLLRVQHGFTQKLLKEASWDKTYKVFLNTPYGSPPILIGYQTVILIAGGSGVSFILPLFLDILRRARTGKDACQKILFIWVIRDTDHIHWIANSLGPVLKDLPPFISVAVKLYITRTTTVVRGSDESLKESRSDSTDGNERSKSGLYSTILQSPCVEVYSGRPNLQPVISKEVDESTGRMSINVCGPRSLVNDTRAAIRLPRPMDVLRGGPTISFHTEAFGL